MGYSMHTPLPSEAVRDALRDFLEKHYRPFSEIARGSGPLYEHPRADDVVDDPWEHEDTIYGPTTDDISYGSDFSKWYVGFDFSFSSGPCGAWMKDFLRWVAVRMGVRHTFKGMDYEVPYIVYDHPEGMDDEDSVWPVFIRGVHQDIPKRFSNYIGDELGFRGWSHHVQSFISRSKAYLNKKYAEDKSECWVEEFRSRERNWDFYLKMAERGDSYTRPEIERLNQLWDESPR